ncbi:helix-turn-helix domain-containing protein [Isoptericola sp. NEAU-Y5]|uniref:Helix-turn-helix domain-containing protein n=1 Tax=Isoptericola luteus TaxID=2879484 RepID=A0ABS7ZBU3_9MICO|nr:helix-turn-helix domain-containing protein [Isoptericola sp. NEAU-Y5]MCA5892514.1 helix-turn-helix domain-containing protein [Isoptericola sp. NEAU-Y5]
MTEQDVPVPTAGSAAPRPRYRGRHLPMVAVVVAATIATALAYSGMVLFGLEVAHMSRPEAYALAGFLEVSLVAVALMARNAALEGRPYGVLLTLTWVLSGTSGMFAALHEVAVPNGSTPYMVAFRFVPPLVAALMWHLALVGERHMVTGHTLDERRRERRVHQYVVALESWRDARLDSSGSRQGMRKVRGAHRRQRTARDGALKLLTVEDFERRMQVWVERLEAAERHGNRLDSIGASSAERGMTRGPVTEVRSRALVGRDSVPALTASAEPTPFAEEFHAALVDQPGERPRAARETGADATWYAEDDAEQARGDWRDEDVRAAADDDHGATTDAADADADADADAYAGVDAEPERDAEDVRADAAPDGWPEPLPETGHTRRVEMFDLMRPDLRAAAESRALANDEHQAPGDLSADEQFASERDRLIVELAAEGLTQSEIAERVSASRTTVSRVVRKYRPVAV